MRRPRPALIVMALSALVLVSVPIGVAVAGSNAPVIVAPVGEEIRADIAKTKENARAAEQALVQFPRVEKEIVVSQPAPVALSIPRFDVTADIDPVGVASDGWAEIPDDVSRVGWYRFGSAPGATSGSSVIVGHRDGWNEGAGALYNVAQLEPGDPVIVAREDGSTITYEVVSREAFGKDDLPTRELFSELGDPRLTLISCIGYFDRSNGGYQENVVVTAIPVSTSPGASAQR